MRTAPMEAGWFYSPKQIVRYLATRPTTLKPPRTKLRNPYKILRELDSHQWHMFFAGFIGWTWDSFDFFTVSLTVTEIAEDFNVENSAVTWGMTVTLMLRSVGALIFGAVSDRYGRKWPMIINLVLFIILELASGFCNTLPQFLGVRSLYGIAMGGLFGPAAATALEDLPYDARGVLSGLFELGYSVGYLLAAVFYRALVPTTEGGWRSLFWFGAGPPVLIILYRWWLPETNGFQVMAAEREARLVLESQADGHEGAKIEKASLKAWIKESWEAIKENWVVFVFLVFLMTGWNSISHGSQDFYPSFLKNQVEMNATQTTIVSCIGQIGAVIGGTTLGYFSTFLGRRLTMIIGCICGGALIPAYIIPHNMALVGTAFVMQFFVMGVWGPMPIFLTELAPPALRSTAVGLTYQLGNLASSASSTIQSTIGERFPLPPKCTPAGECTERFDYGRVIAIFLGAVWAWNIVFTFFAPEMSEDERQEEAEKSEAIEGMRKSGLALEEIGKRMAQMAWEAEKGVAPGEDQKKDVEVEHKDAVQPA